MELFNDLYEVYRYCQQLIKLKMTQIENFPLEELTVLYEQANCLVREETFRLANELGIMGVADVQLHGLNKTNVWGKCYKDGSIVLSFSILFDLDYRGIQSVLIHELCHIVHHNHKKEFWELYESCLRQVGIIDGNYNGWNEKGIEDDPFMYCSPCTYVIHRRKNTIIRNKLFSRRIRRYVMTDVLPIQRPVAYRSNNLDIVDYSLVENRKQEYVHCIISTILRQQNVISVDFSDLKYLINEKEVYTKEFWSDNTNDIRPIESIKRQIIISRNVDFTIHTSCIVCIQTKHTDELLMKELPLLLNFIVRQNANIHIRWTYGNNPKLCSSGIRIILSR